jgi:hypothetical protein
MEGVGIDGVSAGSDGGVIYVGEVCRYYLICIDVCVY